MASEHPSVVVVIEYLHRDEDGQYWIDIHIEREPCATIGPFDTQAERDLTKADLLNMMRARGAKDLPVLPQ